MWGIAEPSPYLRFESHAKSSNKSRFCTTLQKFQSIRDLLADGSKTSKKSRIVLPF
jgi:hypothetical protein